MIDLLLMFSQCLFLFFCLELQLSN